MRLWTIQGIEMYEMLQRSGYTYCTEPSMGDIPNFMISYRWMAEQMRRRIGPPPIEGIKYPMWGWYQYNSAKSNKPPQSVYDAPEGISAYMEIEIPERDVLLSEFSNWHAPLNLCALSGWKAIDKKTDLLDKKAGRKLNFEEYPIDIQKEIEQSWEAIFDLDRRDMEVGRRHKRNRSIQATFWLLKSEHVISTEFLEKRGNVIKVIASPSD